MAGHKNRRALHLARQEAARSVEGVNLDIDPADALQEVLDRAVSMLRFAGSKADALEEDDVMVNTAFGPVMNAWARLETDMRQEVGALASRMVQIGIADRAVKVQEAKAALLVQAIMAAARDAGIPRDQVRRLGPALRTQLRVLEGGAQEEKAA